ncbi:DUF736 domain-containing protein [Cupriavidus necator]|uniref:DUF736 domain-containing protein n=1 Tax=Cupriavidus necator TaxID=106590 RepID=A0A367P635_CUPNE|nr:DUF736 domain-containing protein [Cupriavidus necator]RCJ03252.1 DUF736 domain-containing protein [Cupriavidus necator]
MPLELCTRRPASHPRLGSEARTVEHHVPPARWLPHPGGRRPRLCGAPHNYDIGAAWKKISQSKRPYLSATLDDPSFPATIYARLIEEDDGMHNLIWSRSMPAA